VWRDKALRGGPSQRYSHVRGVKLQAQKILCLIFQAVQHGRRWAGQEARSSKRLIKL
jgi:hypothetical protein